MQACPHVCWRADVPTPSQGCLLPPRPHDDVADLVAAARLALPPEARTTGATRIQQLGLDVGDRAPVHFVVQGDLHLDLDGVFLHRTVKMPPHCSEGVEQRGCLRRLLRRSEDDRCHQGGLRPALSRAARPPAPRPDCSPRRSGAEGCRRRRTSCPFSTAGAGRLPEAELLAYVVFAGLPMPDVNVAIEVAPGVGLTPDLRFADYGQVVEYEGGQHQDDRAQYVADIDRYALYRRHGVALRADHQGADAVTQSHRAAGARGSGRSGDTTVRRRTSTACGRPCSSRSPTSYASRAQPEPRRSERCAEPRSQVAEVWVDHRPAGPSPGTRPRAVCRRTLRGGKCGSDHRSKRRHQGISGRA